MEQHKGIKVSKGSFTFDLYVYVCTSLCRYSIWIWTLKQLTLNRIKAVMYKNTTHLCMTILKSFHFSSSNSTRQHSFALPPLYGRRKWCPSWLTTQKAAAKSQKFYSWLGQGGRTVPKPGSASREPHRSPWHTTSESKGEAWESPATRNSPCTKASFLPTPAAASAAAGAAAATPWWGREGAADSGRARRGGSGGLRAPPRPQQLQPRCSRSNTAHNSPEDAQRTQPMSLPSSGRGSEFTESSLTQRNLCVP